MKRTVYVDSSIPSYLFDDRIGIAYHIEVTKEWWDEERVNFDIRILEMTIVETSVGDYPNKEKVLRFIAQLPVLSPDPQIDDIVRVYLDNSLMPKSSQGDAYHLAYASFYKCDFLLTWNCNHLANANKRQHIRIINTRLGLPTPEIITPLELFTEEVNDD